MRTTVVAVAYSEAVQEYVGARYPRADDESMSTTLVVAALDEVEGGVSLIQEYIAARALGFAVARVEIGNILEGIEVGAASGNEPMRHVAHGDIAYPRIANRAETDGSERAGVSGAVDRTGFRIALNAQIFEANLGDAAGVRAIDAAATEARLDGIHDRGIEGQRVMFHRGNNPFAVHRVITGSPVVAGGIDAFGAEPSGIGLPDDGHSVTNAIARCGPHSDPHCPHGHVVHGDRGSARVAGCARRRRFLLAQINDSALLLADLRADHCAVGTATFAA
ncbi:hypothetical protein D3C72_1394010 [compost metagenome]